MGDIVISLENLTTITVDEATNTVQCQTGNHLGNLAETIFDNGKRALPHGSCPYVRAIHFLLLICLARVE
jgi:FAD/FMN-containing dehydrogenase